MADNVKRVKGLSFSDLRKSAHNELTDADIIQNILNEEEIISGSKSVESKNKNRNAFDWEKEDEDVANLSMEMFGSNIMGVKAHDYEIAHEFLKNSRAEKGFLGASNESCNTKEESIDGLSTCSFGDLHLSEVRGMVSARKSNSDFSISSAKVNQLEDQKEETQASHGQDLSDIVYDKPQISSREFNCLKQQLRDSKQVIEELRNEKSKLMPPLNMIRKIILGKSYSLEKYKSLKEKLELLDCSLKTSDGNAINAVLIFLEQTLNQDIFISQLRKRPNAFNHYMRYLEENTDLKAEMDMLLKMNKKEDAFILNYRHIDRMKNPTTKLNEMDKLLSTYRSLQDNFEIFSYIQEERKLLQRQLEIEKEDEIMEKQRKNVVMLYQHPRSNSVVMKSLLTTLYYCTLYHFDKLAHRHHPLNIKTDFKLNEKQYEWTVIPACAKLHRWTSISDVLSNTSWLRKRTERSAIGFYQICQILHNANATTAVMEKYIRLIENADQKFKMAALCKCHDVAIDTIVHLRDKQKLEKYRQNVIYEERLRTRITSCLNDTSIKWK